MTNDAFDRLKSKVFFKLDNNLSPLLTYHCRNHTEDVLFHTERIAGSENMTDPTLLLQLKVAALFHDTGFLDVYTGHEERSCGIMIDTLQDDEFDVDEIELMSKMIMATKLPQSPESLQEKILCDADLDYLGRPDFPEINKRLKDELLAFGFLNDPNDWNGFQVAFLRKHQYFTESSRIIREPVKQNYLSTLLKEVETDKP